MLDLAERWWPEERDRRQLLLRLARVGSDAIGAEVGRAAGESAREAQRAALVRAVELVDLDALLGDAAWR
jgi:hypothetical protein